MDFLKSAVASAIAAKGPPFPYTFGDKVDMDPSIWTLYNGTKRVRRQYLSGVDMYLWDVYDLVLTEVSPQEDGSPCSIFSFEVSSNRSALPLAKNALKKLRTLRHPGVIRVLDTVEVQGLLKRGGHVPGLICAKDRFIHLHCHGEAGPLALACEEEELDS